jgi:hypothetical protein
MIANIILNIILNEVDKKECLDFAQKVVSTNTLKYAQRNQTDIDKIIEDIYVGKIAEYAVYNWLKSKGKAVQKPDTEIYQARYKSFDADLKDDKFNYHIKCMRRESAARFGLSWSFQIEDKLLTKPKTNDVLVLCQYNEDNHSIDIMQIIKALQVQQKYTNPVLKKLHGIKKVLEWKNIHA